MMTRTRHEQLRAVLSKASRDTHEMRDPRGNRITTKQLRQAMADLKRAVVQEQERRNEWNRIAKGTKETTDATET